MSQTDYKPHQPLLQGISPFEVDFVIPRVDIDVPLCIDPFLLFKSRDPAFSAMHDTILNVFNSAISALRGGNLSDAQYLFDFPEVFEIGLGYTAHGKRGSGLGSYLSRLIIETLNDSPALMDRGVRHVEEMQLVSVGIAADRTSDIAANIIKRFLIDYTQRQSVLWNLPLTIDVPVNHIFDPERFEWYDDYADLPVSPVDNSPIILVPRRIVRSLPWINYDDYLRMEFSAYLRAKRVKAKVRAAKTENQRLFDKNEIVTITRSEIERIDRFVDRKELTAAQAQPSLTYLEQSEVRPEADRLKELLSQMSPGAANASQFQRLFLEIANYLFNPELIDGSLEVKTVDGTERRDVIFTNDSDQPFWTYLRTEHSSFLLMFEAKNTAGLTPGHYNQTATYLGDRLGRLGFIVTRNEASEANQRKAFSIYNDSSPRKIILVLSDSDLMKMLDMKCNGEDPMRYVQKIYRVFRQSVQ